MTISLQALKAAIAIKEQIAALEAKLANILSGVKTPGKRGRKKAAGPVIAEEPAKPAKKAKKAKRKMSAEGRERIRQAQKARWAAKRKG